MAIGLIIGAAIASKAVVSKAYDAYQTAKAENPDSTIDFGAAKQKAVDGINNWLHSPAKNRTSEKNQSQEIPVNTDKVFCVYCGGMIVLSQGNVKCPHCGSPIQRASLEAEKLVQMEQPVPKGPPQNSGYYIDCYSCRTTIRYVISDVIRSPGANKAVKKQGFRGHTGEVQCPRCGVYLPHFESNWK